LIVLPSISFFVYFTTFSELQMAASNWRVIMNTEMRRISKRT